MENSVNGLKTPEHEQSGMFIAIITFIIIGFIFYLGSLITTIVLSMNDERFIAVMALLLFLVVLSISMTITYYGYVKNNKTVPVLFKVFYMLFSNFIAGILMLCDNDK